VTWGRLEGNGVVKLAIMQPYFLPYIGYFQLIEQADRFIVYDNIKYTKRGWINRNRLLLNGRDEVFSLPLQRASDSLDVIHRELAADFDARKLLNQIKGAYARAPHFSQTYALLEQIVGYDDRNLFRFILNSLINCCNHLGIKTPLSVSSEIPIDHCLKGEDKVLALCHASGATVYINAIGGVDLYNRATFAAQGIELRFIKSKASNYRQFDGEFVPWLSIVDVMMFNSIDVIRTMLTEQFELL
jgi:hypothetical protein